MVFLVKADYVESKLETVWPLLDNATKTLERCQQDNIQIKEIVR